MKIKKPQKFDSKILEIKKLTKNIKHFSLSVPKDFTFTPGQYISIILDDKNKGIKLRRPYSICSSPSIKNKIELCIKIIPEGLITPKIDKLKTGDKIEILGPLGLFKIEGNNKNIIFVSNGTGIGPFRSMINSLLESSFEKKVILVSGCKDIPLYDNEFKSLEEKYNNFTYLLILSEPLKNWKGQKGRVQKIIEELKDLENTDFYLCGLKDMINSVRSILVKKGVEMKSIFSEKYD